MKKYLFCTRDVIAEVFMPPFAMVNEASACRDFTQAVTQKPEIKNDLELYAVGEFNDNSGIITPYPTPKRLMSGFEVTQGGQIDDELPMNDNETQVS